MLEAVSPTQSSTPANAGGAAPAHRQCGYTKADGHKCHDWSIRGQNHCARHHRFLQLRPERPIEVPLLEDEASVVLLLSQTLRALAWGTIPVANGRLLLAGCRQAFAMQGQRLEMAKFRLRLRRLGIPEGEIFDEPRTNTEPDLSPVPGAPCPVSGSENPEPCSPSPDPNSEPCRVQFRDLKKNWDKDLLRGENAMTDMHFKRYGETEEDFVAAHATPFENLAKEETVSVASL